MNSVFNIHPNELKIKLDYLTPLQSNTLTFLNIIKEKYDIDISIYYNIINYNNEFKLKNILYFMNLRLKKINMKIDYDNVNYENFDNIMINFINNDIVKCIIVMNLLQHYIYP